MGPAEFVVELRTRLLLDESSDADFCPCCDSVLDTKGHHCRMCVAGPDRNLRHNHVRNAYGKFSVGAALNPELERPGLLPPNPEEPSSGQRRPADVYLPMWTGGTPATLDFAVTSPQRLDAIARVAQGGPTSAEAYELFKRTYLNTAEECARQCIRFIPMVSEPSGAWPLGHCVHGGTWPTCLHYVPAKRRTWS